MEVVPLPSCFKKHIDRATSKPKCYPPLPPYIKPIELPPVGLNKVPSPYERCDVIYGGIKPEVACQYCQCELGNEKLMSAPPTISRTTKPKGDAAMNRYPTAPGGRQADTHKCRPWHILVTFVSPMHPDEMFKKAFLSDTPLKYVKRSLAKLLRIPHSNLLLTKTRTVLRERNLLRDLQADSEGNLMLDVFTVNSDPFYLSSIPMESYVHDLVLGTIPTKPSVRPYLSVKFKVHNQIATFTRSYNSTMRIEEVKRNLAGLFGVKAESIVLAQANNHLKDRMTLLDLESDEYGICCVELFMKYNEKLKLEKLYKENPVNDVISVLIPYGDTLKHINVEVFNEPMRKPFLGGYRHKVTGAIYHHAYTQTPQQAEKLLPEQKTCRDTQTAEERIKINDTPYSRATQMSDCSQPIYIPNVTDRIVVPKPYETYEKMIKRLNHDHYATVIQRAFRHHQFRQKVKRWLADCMAKIACLKEHERLEMEAMQRRLHKDLVTRTFPKTREDFDQLYAMVDHWKHMEIERISRLHSKGPKIAEFTLLLDKEVELLRTIEDYRVQVRNDSRRKKQQQFLEEITKPVAWYGRQGQVIEMLTIENQKAAKLKDLFNAFTREDIDMEKRMELLVDVKYALDEFRHPLAEEIIRLLDRECDLIVRKCSKKDLQYLRQRITASIFQLIKTSELNSKVTRRKHIKDFRAMENGNLFLCELCHQVKHYKDFQFNTQMNRFSVCQSCSWKDVNERYWVDMTPYTFILRAVQREERRLKCWGSLAFVMLPKDIFYMVEKLWYAHSAISENNDLMHLRLARWYAKKDWAPWNCFLVTVTEMKAHLKLENPDDAYDEELVQKVRTRHSMAKAAFERLLTTNKEYTETGQWEEVRVPAHVRVNGNPKQ